MNFDAIDSNADLRRRLAAQREARSAAVLRLKAVAEKAVAGRKLPITDKFTREEPEGDALADSTARLPTAARIKRCREKVVVSRRARSAGIRTFKETSMAVVQFMRQTVRIDREGEKPNENGDALDLTA